MDPLAASAPIDTSTARGRSGALLGLVRTGLLTAVVDGLFSGALSAWFYDSSVARLFQGVAATVFGPAAFDGGIRMGGVGVLMHIGVAFAWSAACLLLMRQSTRIRGVAATPLGALKVAAVFGPCVWMVMSLVVIPVLLQRPPAIGYRWWVQFFGHIPFVGFPMVWSLGRDARVAASTA